jgi:hypothetical protein
MLLHQNHHISQYFTVWEEIQQNKLQMQDNITKMTFKMLRLSNGNYSNNSKN